jgi:hypothetical protein
MLCSGANRTFAIKRGLMTDRRRQLELLETLLVRHLRSRGYRTVVPKHNGDRICLLDGNREGKKLNLTELAKDIAEDLE